MIEALRQTGVRRLIVQSTLGAGDSRGNLNFWWKRVMFGLLLRAAYSDHQEPPYWSHLEPWPSLDSSNPELATIGATENFQGTPGV